MKLSISREAQPRRRRSIYHLALGVLMLLACTLISCEKNNDTPAGTTPDIQVQVRNLSAWNATVGIVRTREREWTYLETAPHETTQIIGLINDLHFNPERKSFNSWTTVTITNPDDTTETRTLLDESSHAYVCGRFYLFTIYADGTGASIVEKHYNY